MMVHVSLCLLLFATCAGQNRCMRHVDVAFLLENTYIHSKPEFQEILRFFQGVVGQFDDTRARFAAATFGPGYREEFPFGKFRNAAEVIDAIGHIVKQDGQRTDIPGGIKNAREMFFTDPRPWSAKVLILLAFRTSGRMFDSIVEAHEARSKGILVIVIVLGTSRSGTKNTKDEYSSLTSRPAKKFLIVVDNISLLKTFQSGLVDTICNAPAMSPCESEAVLECQGKAQEVAFVIDRSNSINKDDFKTQLEFINQLIDSFDIGPSTTRVGAVSFSIDAVVEFYLHTFNNKQDIMSQIANIQYTGGLRTEIGSGLQQVYDSVFAVNLIRERVDKVVILFTDGAAQEFKPARAAADQLKSAHIHLFVVGIGRQINMVELEEMASKPLEDHLFFVSDVGSLDAIKRRVAVGVCEGKP